VRILEALVLALVLEIAWLGYEWSTLEPRLPLRRWELFTPSLGEEGPCWSAGYEVVCCQHAPPAWDPALQEEPLPRP